MPEPKEDDGAGAQTALSAVAAWLQDRAETFQIFLLTLAVVSFAYALEQRWPGSALVVAVLGCLCLAHQGDYCPALLRQLLGFESEGQDAGGDAVQADGSDPGGEEVEAEGDPGAEADDIWPEQGGGNGAVSADDDDPFGMDSFSWQEAAALLPNMRSATQGRPEINKARLDLLLRHMLSAEARSQEQQGTTPQRQKLQRKLLLRRAAAAMAAPEAESESTVSADVASCNGNREDPKTELEELLRELGELDE
eukprot:CAMPEP_0179300480 /NCGR_PEP_ID=MMETSP0797-20121207/47055_1 /TAXON_ID=47934 /ORGANISM="Dinophysis acuminata, Strain DAEP01" /LENGTH=251 /DNA_ID=CAMNT_0021009949 /DNA_START=22 /DNA_END=774 /DNA_ORIENTATION=+